MSRDSSIRSVARVTFSAHRQLPIRWRLAGGSALLTLIILCGFAGAVGALTTERIHEDFDAEVSQEADQFRDQLTFSEGQLMPDGARQLHGLNPDLNAYASANGAIIRILDDSDRKWATTRLNVDLGSHDAGTREIGGYRVETRAVKYEPGEVPGTRGQQLWMQYARPLSDVKSTISVVRLFLLGGVLGGAGLALLAGLMIAKRAMAPISALTETARKIERTRDPELQMPQPEADDEVAELARTLEDMLQSLNQSRKDTETALAHQREFVADASHELRTPLTSVLANLELLSEDLRGDQQEAANSALRSSRRMRRLVADLLLLARADAKRKAPHAPTDLGKVLIEAASELSPLAAGHELSIEAGRAIVDGARDELHQLVLNLMENAIRHTPEGTHIRASVERVEGVVRLSVEDDGPGVPAEIRERIFERFVRGAGDRGGSSGLGLSIVHAVADSHGGTVVLHSPTKNGARRPRGTRFEVTFPASTRHKPGKTAAGSGYAPSAS